jgi:hypothetical protein
VRRVRRAGETQMGNGWEKIREKGDKGTKGIKKRKKGARD